MMPGSISPRWQWIAEAPASTTPDTLELRFPVVAGMSDRFADARVVIPARLNGPNLVIAAGEDVRLRVSPLSTPPGFVGGESRWTLRVGQTCTGSGGFEVQGEGDHPSDVRVPWEWIEAPAPFSREACFRLITLYSSEPPSLGSSLLLVLEFKWHVQVSR